MTAARSIAIEMALRRSTLSNFLSYSGKVIDWKTPTGCSTERSPSSDFQRSPARAVVGIVSRTSRLLASRSTYAASGVW